MTVCPFYGCKVSSKVPLNYDKKHFMHNIYFYFFIFLGELFYTESWKTLTTMPEF